MDSIMRRRRLPFRSRGASRRNGGWKHRDTFGTSMSRLARFILLGVSKDTQYRCAGPGAKTDDDTVDREVTLLQYGLAYGVYGGGVLLVPIVVETRGAPAGACRQLCDRGTGRPANDSFSAVAQQHSISPGNPVVKFGEKQRLWRIARIPQQPHLAIDVGADALGVIDPNTNARILPRLRVRR